jgi:hypothetical protein
MYGGSFAEPIRHSGIRATGGASVQHDTLNETHLPAPFGKLREMAEGRLRAGSAEALRVHFFAFERPRAVEEECQRARDSPKQLSAFQNALVGGH